MSEEKKKETLRYDSIKALQEDRKNEVKTGGSVKVE